MMNFLKENQIKMEQQIKFIKISIIIVLILSIFSIIGTCSNKSSTNNNINILSKRVDSLFIDNSKNQKELNDKLNQDLSQQIETNAIQFFLYSDALDKKELTISDLKARLKKSKTNNVRTTINNQTENTDNIK